MTPCKLWDKAVGSRGYGATCVDGKQCYAHRAAYCEHHGIQLEDIKGKVVRHTCDTPACVEPTHLVLGSHQDNMDDMTSRGRQAKGEQQWKAELTEAQVAEIRATYVRRCKLNGQPALARRFGVAHSTIGRIVRGQIWRV